MHLVGSPTNHRLFQCSREHCSFEGNFQTIVNHARLQHPKLGCNIPTCALPPCRNVGLKHVADLVQHLRQTHDQLLMSEKQRAAASDQPKVPRLRILLPRPDQPNPTIANGSSPAKSAGRPAAATEAATSSSSSASTVQASGDNADRPNESFVCGACGIECTEVALLTCHQQHVHRYRMPIHCYKCGVPMPQLWPVLKNHYDKGHTSSNLNNQLPFVYRRSIYFQVNGSVL